MEERPLPRPAPEPEPDEIDRVFARLKSVEPPPDFVATVLARVQPGALATPTTRGDARPAPATDTRADAAAATPPYWDVLAAPPTRSGGDAAAAPPAHHRTGGLAVPPPGYQPGPAPELAWPDRGSFRPPVAAATVNGGRSAAATIAWLALQLLGALLVGLAAYWLGQAFWTSGAYDLLALLREDNELVSLYGDIYRDALLATVPWTQLGAVALSLAATALTWVYHRPIMALFGGHRSSGRAA